VATIVHILVSLIIAILRGFAEALVLLFSRVVLIVMGVAGLLALVLFLTGSLGFGLRRRG
jgi:hypothetical protein